MTLIMQIVGNYVTAGRARLILALRSRARGLFRARRLQVELKVLDVREPDLLQASGAAAAVLAVNLLERFGRDRLELLVVAPASWASKRRAA
jgi:hypothetical protein